MQQQHVAPALSPGGHADYAAFVLDAFGAADYELDLLADKLRPSQRLNALYGYPAGHPLTAEDCRARYHPDDRAAVNAIVGKALASGDPYFQCEFRILLPDSGARWVLSRGQVILDATGRPALVRGAAIDITERKRAEEALREREERYRALFSSMDEGFCVVQVIFDGERRPIDYRFVEINPVFEQQTGLHSALGRTAQELVPGIESLWAEMYGRVALTGEPTRFVSYAPSMGRWFDVNAFRIGAPDQHTVAVLFNDITERKRAEEALRASEARQAFLLQLNDRLRLLDDPGEIQFAAASALGEHLGASRVGYAEDQGDGATVVVTRNYVDGVPGIEGCYHYDDYGPALLRELHTGRTVVRPDIANDPTLTDAEKAAHAVLQLGATVNVPLVKGGRLVAILFMHCREARFWSAEELALLDEVAARTWDAVERARAEAALRESEERFRQMADAVPQIVWLTDVEGRVEFFNRQWTAYTGAPYEPTTAAQVAAGFVHPDDGAMTVAAFDEARRSGGVFSVEHRIRSAAGTYRWFLVRAEPYRDPQTNAVVRWFGASIDIHDRKHAEERLQQLYTQEQAARAQAEEASRLKDEFLATVSHELRTPLTAFLGYAELLQRRRRDEAYVARTVEKMVQSAKAQAALIEDLLDVSRIVSGKLRLEPGQIELIDVLQAAIDTVRPTIEAKGLHLLVDLDPAASGVLGDASRLQQVAWNLLSNATKFTPAGGRILVRLTRTGDDAELIVSDSGQGIRPEFLPYVFDHFRQADSSSHRAFGGLGLGLGIVRYLVELHGGTVAASSAGVGQGATFTVRLPLARPGEPPRASWAARAAAPSDVAAQPLRGLRVVVVDDQAPILDLVTEILTSEGAVVRACTTARAALALVRSWRPDALVSDIAMPDEDGYWLIEQVRTLSQDEGGGTPAVALTAYVRMQDRLRVLGAGFEQYVPKPVSADELRDVIAGLVRKS